jgi:hypothetical protein
MSRSLSRQVIKTRTLEPYFKTWAHELYYETSLRRTALLIYFRTQTMLLRRILHGLRNRIQRKASMKVLQGRMSRRIWRLRTQWTYDIMRTGFRFWNGLRSHRNFSFRFVRLCRCRRARNTLLDMLFTWRDYCMRLSFLLRTQTLIEVRWRMFEMFRVLRCWTTIIRAHLHTSPTLSHAKWFVGGPIVSHGTKIEVGSRASSGLTRRYVTYVPDLQESSNADGPNSHQLSALHTL